MPRIETRRRHFWNMLLVVGSTLFALLLAEGILAITERNPLRVDHRGFYEYDQLLGWKKKPNARRVNVTEEFQITESTNSQGLRGSEYSYAKRPNECRLLVLGDSYAEGYTVNFEDLFSEVLKQRLNENPAGTYYEVINTGTIGYGTDQELLFFQTEGKRYNPDLVLLMFFQNDPADNNSRYEIYGKYKPLFRVEGNRLVLSKSPDPGTVPADARVEPEHFEIQKWLTKRSRVFRLANDRLQEWGLKENNNSVMPKIPYALRFFSTLPSHEIAQGWEITEMLLAELKKSVEESGAHLIVCYIPSTWEVDPGSWEATKKIYGMTGNHWNTRQVESRLRLICGNHSIVCIGGVEEFEQVARSLGKKACSLYHTKDGHWNTEGNRLAGEILATHFHSWTENKDFVPGIRRASGTEEARIQKTCPSR